MDKVEVEAILLLERDGRALLAVCMVMMSMCVRPKNTFSSPGSEKVNRN
jgi:hypothetical protein